MKLGDLKMKKFKEKDIWVCNYDEQQRLIEIKEITKENIRTDYGWYSFQDFDKMAVKKYDYREYWGNISFQKIKILED